MQGSTDNMMSRHCSYVNCVVLLLLRVAGSEKRVRSHVQFSGKVGLFGKRLERSGDHSMRLKCRRKFYQVGVVFARVYAGSH